MSGLTKQPIHPELDLIKELRRQRDELQVRCDKLSGLIDIGDAALKVAEEWNGQRGIKTGNLEIAVPLLRDLQNLLAELRLSGRAGVIERAVAWIEAYNATITEEGRQALDELADHCA